MIVYRISKRIYIKDLEGTGAGLYGGRWNPPGVRLLYTAGSVSLACLEFLVNNYHLLSPPDICLAKIEIKTTAIKELEKDQLPDQWDEKAFIPTFTQEIGADFVKANEHYVLKIPSVIVSEEHNYLLNPNHPDHQKTIIKEVADPFSMDSRLFKSGKQ
tara:strand:- start:1208 stop:1681 length:474 start_codon:yes stop_codon:yes gene_type:complete